MKLARDATPRPVSHSDHGRQSVLKAVWDVVDTARRYSLWGILMVLPPMNSRITASPGMMS